MPRKQLTHLKKKFTELKNSLESHIEKRKEHIAVKIDLHKKMDEYKSNYPDELQLFYEEEKNKEEIKQLKEKQTKLKEQLKESNISREQVREEVCQLNDKISEFNEDYENTMDNLKSATKIGEDDIIKMENYINKNSLEYDAPHLSTLIDQVCQDKY